MRVTISIVDGVGLVRGLHNITSQLLALSGLFCSFPPLLKHTVPLNMSSLLAVITLGPFLWLLVGGSHGFIMISGGACGFAFQQLPFFM